MHTRILDKLICPNTHLQPLLLFAIEINRNQQILLNPDNASLLPDDDVKTGLLYTDDKANIYFIYEYIPILLNDTDQDLTHLKAIYQEIGYTLPVEYKLVIEQTISRIESKNQSSDGNWNREEMKYYDAAVDTPQLRDKMLNSIQRENLWRIFIPRKEKMINHFETNCKGQWIFEIGCGNARTVARMFNPETFNYNYIRTDISFKRLMVAKMAIPGSDFIQASALNIPIKNNSFNGAISFGMLHHLPRPAEAVTEVNKKLLQGAIFCYHEPVYTSRQFSEKQSAMVRKIFRTYDHSDHDNKINLKESIDELKKANHQIISIVPYNSVFRVVFEAIINRFYKSWQKSKLVMKSVLVIDNFLLKTIVRLSNKLGPQAIIVVSKKL
ncbi:MAG TPA: class I SAM-dependent methyltransferase [Bacteroidia bacterium]|mgnify:CR=1 FL=1|nr:class I SAM-dependent methyltransferase [Bacteroidia bacterium]